MNVSHFVSSFIKYALLFFPILMLFYSCDNHLVEELNTSIDESEENRLECTNAQYPEACARINLSKYNLASEEQQKKIGKSIRSLFPQSETEKSIDDLYEGNICLECTIYDTDEFSVDTIFYTPIIDEGICIGIVLSNNQEKEYFASFIYTSYLHEILTDLINESSKIAIEEWFLPIARLHYFQLVFNYELDKDISYLLTVLDEYIQNKSRIFSVDYQYGLSGAGVPTVVAGSVSVIISCGGGGWPFSGSTNPNNGGWTDIGTSGGGGVSGSGESAVDDKRNEIKEMIDTDEFDECISNTQESTLNLMIDLLNSDLIDPCTGESIDANEIVENVLEEYCQSDPTTTNNPGLDDLYIVTAQNSISYSEFSSSLQSYDYIKTQFSGDSRLGCIYDKFFNSDNNILCDLTARFFGESTSNLIINDDLPSYDAANARTGVTTNGLDIRIRFRRDYVEGNCEIQIMRTLLHELIHAEFRALEIDPSIDNSNFNELYESYRTNESWDHDVMALFYRDHIIAGLEEVYGDAYTNAEYEALSWLGLGEYTIVPLDGPPYQVVISEAWNQLTSSERLSIRNIQDDLENNCHDEDC